jgi:hypothetical protein
LQQGSLLLTGPQGDFMKKIISIIVLSCLSCGKHSKNTKEEAQSPAHLEQESGGEKAGVCSAENSEVCDALSLSIQQLRLDLDKYISEDDLVNAEKTALDLSYQEEQLRLYQIGTNAESEDFLALDNKYKTLKKLFLLPKTNAPGLDHETFKPYTQKELESVARIASTYGPLYIGPSAIGADGIATASSVEVTGDKPWSGYWYPSQKDTMFGTEDSTLQKLDRLLLALHKPAGATAIEKEKFSQFATEWAGLCDAWSMAAVTEPEPKHPVVREGITFKVSDIKALMTKKYEGFEPTMYGSRYIGTAETDGEIDDIRPEALHQLIVNIIGKEGHALIIDDDPGFEVWNKPVFSMRWTVTQDPKAEFAYLVKAWPKMVRNRSEVTEQPTDVYDVKAPTWEYRLYVDRDQVGPDGKSYKVIYGEWLKESRDTHPDMVLYMPKNPDIHPRNKVIADSVSLIDEITAASRR